MTSDDSFSLPFWEHIEELRATLLQVLLIVLTAFCCALFFYHPLLSLFFSPLTSQENAIKRELLQQEKLSNKGNTPLHYSLNSDEELLFSSEGVIEKRGKTIIPPQGFILLQRTTQERPLTLFHPTEGISLVFKLSFFAGLILSSPFWLYRLFLFFLPALQQREKRLLFPFLGASLLFFSLGVAFAYFVTIPIAIESLQFFNTTIGTTLWGAANTLNFFLFLLLSNGLAFEGAVILFFLIHLNVLTYSFLIAYRRHMIVFFFVLAALLTPPDIFTQFLLAIPLIALYECAILYSRFLAPYYKKTAGFID